MPRWFVTGTDTEVGKSVVTACLAESARAHGTVLAAKPVASGVPRGTAGEDAELIAAAAQHDPCVYATFETPVSPHRAAELEGRHLPLDLLQRVRELHADTVLVEGVGGWRVPVSLTPELWVSDLARATSTRVIVVAADRLGVLNHTLLTVQAVEHDGFEVVGVILNRGVAGDGPSRDSNLLDLERLLDVPVVPVPRIDPHHAGARRAAGDTLWSGLGVIWSAPSAG